MRKHPLLELKFEKNLIVVKVKYAAKEDLWVQYYYDTNC